MSLSSDEMRWLATLVDHIIPRTDTPGASDVGVPERMARELALAPELLRKYREGMEAIDRVSRKETANAFDRLESSAQILVLQVIESAPESPAGQFFKAVKDATIDDYYTRADGLIRELGWRRRRSASRVAGCQHPEHHA